MSFEFSNPGFNMLDLSTYYGGIVEGDTNSLGLPNVRTEPVATYSGDFDPLGALSKIGNVFGTVAGAVASFQNQTLALQAAREKASLDRDTLRLQSDLQRTTLAGNAELARATMSGQLDLAKIKGATEVAKGQIELTRARALDQIYASNPGYAITGIPNTVNGGAMFLWLALGAGLLWFARKK